MLAYGKDVEFATRSVRLFDEIMSIISWEGQLIELYLPNGLHFMNKCQWILALLLWGIWAEQFSCVQQSDWLLHKYIGFGRDSWTVDNCYESLVLFMV